MDKGGKKWRFVGIYGWLEAANKRHTWELITRLCKDEGPIVFGGDFNEVLYRNEIEGGAGKMRRSSSDFQNTVESLELRDLGYNGIWYTWERGKRKKNKIRERLDRFLASQSWCAAYPMAQVFHLTRFKSDHTPILLRCDGRPRGKRRKERRFRFETAWLLEEGCEKVVREA
ncbi:AdoMet-dependent rRNA methyltransferase SPB1 [Bienertia sinuspersici]